MELTPAQRSRLVGYMAALNDTDRRVLAMSMAGKSQRAIAKEVGLSQPRICSKLRRLTAGLQAAEEEVRNNG